MNDQTQTHLSTQFDDDLEHLRSNVLEMGGLVESQINTVSKAYTEHNSAAVLDVMENDHEINKFEKSIDDLCIKVIAKRQPTASDLRLVMAVSKMVTDLERSGDEIKKMAKSIRRIQDHKVKTQHDTTDIKHLASAASLQVRNALDSFARLDTTMAKSVLADDEALDTEFKAVVRQLITYMMEDPRSITTAMDVITIARAIERVGDHAKNVAEQVIYIVDGRDIRHTKSAQDS